MGEQKNGAAKEQDVKQLLKVRREIAHVRVGQSVKLLRENLKALAQKGNLLRMDGNLPCLGASSGQISLSVKGSPEE